MPTKILEITDAPVDLLTALDVDGIPLGLQVGQQYTGRYTAVGPQSILKALEVEVGVGAQVTANSPALPVRVFEDLLIIPVSGQAIFVWSERSGQLVINDIT